MSLRFSVVIPMYNASRTILATITSCLEQEYLPYEVIVVDDCSTDNCVALVQQTFGDRVKVLPQAANAGPAAARNSGWDYASGDFVAFLDSDDQWHREKLLLCNQVLQARPQIDLLWHYYQTADLPEIFNPATAPLRTSFLSLLRQNPISTSCVLFRRNTGLRFDNRMRYCEDYDLALRFTYTHQTWVLPLFLTQLDRPVLSEGGLSANRKRMRMGEMQAYSHLARLHPAFTLLIPILYIWSGVKHLLGALWPSRKIKRAAE